MWLWHVLAIFGLVKVHLYRVTVVLPSQQSKILNQIENKQLRTDIDACAKSTLKLVFEEKGLHKKSNVSSFTVYVKKQVMPIKDKSCPNYPISLDILDNYNQKIGVMKLHGWRYAL